MRVRKPEIEGLFIIEPEVYADDRGAFMEAYNAERFRDAGIVDAFVQDNEAVSVRGVLRGLHYQVEPHAQTKLVRVIRGRIFDVAVDIRPGSPTFGKWFGIELSGDNRLQLYIPAGFAHGYLCLEDQSVVLYKCGSSYARDYEGGIRYDDPQIAIDWPVHHMDLKISDRDRGLPFFGNHRTA